jgi:hypothetical protein
MRWPNVIAKKLACVVCAGSPSTQAHPSILEQLRAVISTAAADASNVAGFVFVIAFTPRKGERVGDVASGSKDSVLNTALVQLDYPQGTARRRPLSSPLIWRSSATPSLQTSPSRPLRHVEAHELETSQKNTRYDRARSSYTDGW